MVAFTLGASLVIVRYGALPRWTGWVGLVVTPLVLIMPWVSVPTVWVWVQMVSVVLVIQVWSAPRRAAAATVPATP